MAVIGFFKSDVAEKGSHPYGELMTIENFWQSEGLEHIHPQGFGQFPEGFDVCDQIKEIVREIPHTRVIDFGCGYGRLCEGFEAEKYLGIDINTAAIEEAKKKFSGYQFEIAKEGVKGADLFFAYTVFLHLNDSEVDEVLRRMRCKWLVVAEILGREWRRDGLPPVYNRDLEEYVKLMRAHDLILHRHTRKPYMRYATSPWYQGKNTDISFLVFKKCLRNPLV